MNEEHSNPSIAKLVWVNEKPQLETSAGQLSIDFVNDKKNYWRLRTKGKSELLAKAMGAKKKYKTVIDATAGLGYDSVFLAQLGFQVTGFEQSPFLYLLLSEALKDAQAEIQTKDWASRLKFALGNSVEVLERLSEEEFPDVIYLDPMFPEKKKSNLPKREMQIMQSLESSYQTSEQALIDMALTRAKFRVVVKRGLRSPVLKYEADHSYKGSSVRYDLYTVGKKR